MFRKLYISSFKLYTIRKYSTGKVVGFIGCGSMGSTLIKRLLKKKINVICYDKKETARQRVKSMGATVVGSSAEVASQTKIIFTLLAEYRDIISIFEDSKYGILKSLQKDSIIVDLSTIGPVNAFRLEHALEEHKVQFISAPVCGGTSYDGILFLVGGRKATLDKVEAYLNLMGKTNREKQHIVYHIGEEIGDGQAARVCALLLLGCCMAGTAEVMNLAIRLGLNPKKFADAMCESSAQCWAIEHYNPVPTVSPLAPGSKEYAAGEAIKVIVKTLAVAQDVATKMHSPIPVTALACQIYSLAHARGYGDKDFSVIYKMFQQKIPIL